VICEKCRVAWHSNCDNNDHPAERVGVRPNEGLWCDCQHKERNGPLVVAGMKFNRVLEEKDQS
jgi:hypothetical protein